MENRRHTTDLDVANAKDHPDRRTTDSMKDRRLSEFVSDDDGDDSGESVDSDDAAGEDGAFGTEDHATESVNDDGAADTDDDPTATENGPTATDDESVTDVVPADVTFEWTPEGNECSVCGETVQRRWRRETEAGRVCADCKEW